MRNMPYLCVATAFYLCILPTAHAQDRKFATKGSVELGGSVSYSSSSPFVSGSSNNVSATYTGASTSTIILSPFFGWFIIDGLEIGVDPFQIYNTTRGSDFNTQILMLLAPSWNFNTGTMTYPFVEALIGYSSVSTGTSASGLAYGARAGVKMAVTNSGLLNLGVNYIHQSYSANSDTSFGLNTIAANVGFTIVL